VTGEQLNIILAGRVISVIIKQMSQPLIMFAMGLELAKQRLFNVLLRLKD
jgi:hypothetical protein